MGEGTSRVNRSPEDVEREERQLREDLDPMLHALDIRRHELTDWRLQLRRHGPTLMKAGAVVAGVFVAVGVAKDVGRSMRRRMRSRGRHSRFASDVDATM